MTPDGPNQSWVADITYVAITTGFVYLAAILGILALTGQGAIGRSIDARLAVAALKAANSARDPPRGCASFRPWITICLRRLVAWPCESTVSEARWVDAATLTTMRRPRAL